MSNSTGKVLRPGLPLNSTGRRPHSIQCCFTTNNLPKLDFGLPGFFVGNQFVKKDFCLLKSLYYTQIEGALLFSLTAACK